MRILLLTAEMTGVGGVERLLASLATLLGAGHDVHVASFDPPGSAAGVPLPCPFHPLGGERPRALPLRALTYADQARRLRALERRLGIDVTISNLWRADLVSALAGAHARRVALAHINIVGNPTNRLLLRLRPLVALAYRRMDRVVAVSAALAQELAALFALDPARVSAIPNFVTVPRALAGTPAIAGRIVWCGRMVPEKNVPALVRVVAGLARDGAPVSLDLIGDGPERAAAEAAAAPAPHAIRFHGRLADPWPMVAPAAALALPSHSEGLPMVLIEAFALGVPVIAADCPSGGVRDALGADTPHDPERTTVERTATGMLLPIPASPDREAVWRDTLLAVADAPSTIAAMRAPAQAAAESYAPAAVAARWQWLLEEVAR